MRKPSRNSHARHRARSLKSAATPKILVAADGVELGRLGATSPLHARLLESLTSEQRKQYPMTSGLLDYFPDALAEVSHVSWAGNEKHNPGQELHWARGKSMDHADCCGRHLQQRGELDTIQINGKPVTVRHSAQLAWRALALLQEELEREFGFELPKGATSPD